MPRTCLIKYPRRNASTGYVEEQRHDASVAVTLWFPKQSESNSQQNQLYDFPVNQQSQLCYNFMIHLLPQLFFT